MEWKRTVAFPSFLLIRPELVSLNAQLSKARALANELAVLELLLAACALRNFYASLDLSALPAHERVLECIIQHSVSTSGLTINQAMMPPRTNPAKTSEKKCELSATRLKPMKRAKDTATIWSKGFSSFVSVLTAV